LEIFDTDRSNLAEEAIPLLLRLLIFEVPIEKNDAVNAGNNTTSSVSHEDEVELDLISAIDLVVYRVHESGHRI